MLPGISNVLRREKDRTSTHGDGSTRSVGNSSSGGGQQYSYNRPMSPPRQQQYAPPYVSSSSPGPPGPSQPLPQNHHYMQQQQQQQQQQGQRWATSGGPGSSPSHPMASNMTRTSTSASSQSYTSAASPVLSSLLPEEHRAREREKNARYTIMDGQQQQQQQQQAGYTDGKRSSQQQGARALGAADGVRSVSTTGGGSGKYSSSHMESSVTRLLVATKMLLEALTKWSLNERTETQVSDIYVRLGNDFNVANIAFGSYGIDMSDLASVPDDLRDCLEQCLSEEASPQTLETHLPRIREIIIALLQGLKSKQAEYKQLLIQRRASARSSKNRGDRIVTANGSIPTSTSQANFASTPAIPAVPEPHVVSRSDSRGSEASRRVETSPVVQRDVRPERPLSRRTNSSSSSKSALPMSQNSKLSPQSAAQESPRALAQNAGARVDSLGESQSLSTSRDSRMAHSSRAASEGANGQPSTHATSPEVASTIPLSNSLDTATARGAALDILDGSNASSGSTEEIVDVGEAADPSVRALKSRDALERRASKRFSAYTFTKMGVGLSHGLGMSSYNLSSVAAGNERIPGRGHSRKQGSKGSHDASSEGGFPFRGNGRVRSGLTTPSEEFVSDNKSVIETPTRKRMTASRQSPRHSPRVVQPSTLALPVGSSNLNSSTESLPYVDAVSPSTGVKDLSPEQSSSLTPPMAAMEIPPVPPLPTPQEQARLDAAQVRGSLSQNDSAHVPFSGPSVITTKPSAAELTPRANASFSTMSLFFQLGRQTKRVTIDLDPTAPFKGLSTGKLRMLFMDKFQYSPGKEDFPSIYIKDTQSGVTFELEDLSELHDGTVLTLNIEPLDQVKQHLDLTLGSITRELRDLRSAIHERDRESVRRASAVQGHESVFSAQPMTRLTDAQFTKAGERVAQLKRATEMASPRIDSVVENESFASQPLSEVAAPDVDLGVQLAGDQLRKQYDEVINVRRQLAIMSQVQDDFKSDFHGLLGTLREQAKRVRAIAASDVPTERNFILAGKARLDSNSQEVLTLIEDLLDSVDDLKADVIQRGVKPKPHTMKKLEDEIARATQGLDDLSKYVDTVKPSWKKTWEAELQNIVDEQEFLNHQEGLIADLKEDHANLQDVFFNIQEVVKLRGANRFNLISAGQGNGNDNLSNVALRTYIPPPAEEGHEGLPTVMMEVMSQSVDHEKRLKALQAAEKQRQKELRQRKVQEDGFQNELTTFVDGKALRKTGGYLETERVRGRRDKLTIQAMFGGGGSGGAPVEGGTVPQRPQAPRRLVIKKNNGSSQSVDAPDEHLDTAAASPQQQKNVGAVPPGYI